jgi:RNA polymerase sigma factor (sigma-70 family)
MTPMANMALDAQNPVRRRGRVSPELLGRVRDWIERDIEFVRHPMFKKSDAAGQLAKQRPESLDRDDHESKPEPGLAFVAGLVESPLLTHEEETYLFTWMNFLKFRAEQSRRRLDLNAPDGSLVDRIDADLSAATAVRNRIVQSNLRLVVALARKLSGSLDQMSELIGEATLPLIRSVELFDISLGNRFSTYATWAVRNHMLRCLKRRQSAADRVAGHDDVWLDRLPDLRSSADEEAKASGDRAESVQRLLTSLNERERLVISARYGLDGQPRGQSLQDIAERVGLSKERVRQIAIAAIEKMQGIATTDRAS